MKRKVYRKMLVEAVGIIERIENENQSVKYVIELENQIKDLNNKLKLQEIQNKRFRYEINMIINNRSTLFNKSIINKLRKIMGE